MAKPGITAAGPNFSSFGAQGATAMAVGTSFEDEVAALHLKWGFKPYPASLVATLRGNDGQGMLNRAVSLLDDKVRGLMIREKMCDAHHTFTDDGETGMKRDFTLVMNQTEGGLQLPWPAVIEVEAKLQNLGGTVDEKAIPTFFNILADRPDYGIVLWTGVGPKIRTYGLLHNHCLNVEVWAQAQNTLPAATPLNPRGPTQMHWVRTLEDYQLLYCAIEAAILRGEVFTYRHWLDLKGWSSLQDVLIPVLRARELANLARETEKQAKKQAESLELFQALPLQFYDDI